MSLQDNRNLWEQDIIRLEEEIAALQLGEFPALDDLEDRVGVLEGQIVSVSGDVSDVSSRVSVLETFGYDQVLYVAKNGLDTNNGKQHAPFLTITAALNAITDASPTKRYVILVQTGAYTEASLSLKANVYIVGEGQKESVSITGAVSLHSSFSGSADNRSGFARVILSSACDFNWQTVTSAAGKLYFNEVSFSSTINMYGHNNATAQAQFNDCVIFGNLTVSGINVGVFTNNVCFGNITLNQHPNGGMASVLNAAGGYCAGTVSMITTVSNFGRRSALFARSFWMNAVVINGPSSYADVTDSSLPAAGPTISNGGNIVYLNAGGANKTLSNLSFPTAVNNPIMPATTGATNFGDWNKQWAWSFAYVHASSGSDVYLISYGPSYGADSVGRNVGIYADGAGLQANVNGGNIDLATSAISGTGIRGKITLDGRVIDVTSKKIVNVANGTDDTDAVNKGQLDDAIAAIPPVDLTGYATEEYVDDAIAAIPPVDLSQIETDISDLQDDVLDLTTRLETIENRDYYLWNTMSVAVASSTQQQYVNCDHTVVEDSLNVHVDGMKAHVIRDFTLSVVDEKTRITWVNTFAIGGVEEVAIGETVYISYNYIMGAAPSLLSYSTPVTYTQNTAITNNVPTVTGNVVSYAISPSLPAGLNFNTSTGVISGTPTEVSAAANYVVTATNEAGSTTATISITVEAEAVTSDFITWDLLTGYQAGSLTITPTSGVSGGISLSGNDVAVKSDVDKATGDFDYTFKFDWSTATSVVDMFVGVTGNNVTAGITFYPNLTCIYGNGNNPDTAYLWHNGSSVGGTTQTLLNGVNTYRLVRTGANITHYLNGSLIYSASATLFTAYPSVRTMGNSVLTEAFISEPSEYFTYTYNPDNLVISNTGGVSGGPTISLGAVSQLDPFAGDFSVQFKFNWDSFTEAQGYGNPSGEGGFYPVMLGLRTNLNNNNNQTGMSVDSGAVAPNKRIRFWIAGTSNTLDVLAPGDHTFVMVKTGNDWKYYIDGVLKYQTVYGFSSTLFPFVRTRGFAACSESKEIEFVTWNVAGKTGAGTVTTGANGLITRSDAGGAYNLNVLSNETITGDGYVEFVVPSTPTFPSVVFGLAEVNSPTGSFNNLLIGCYLVTNPGALEGAITTGNLTVNFGNIFNIGTAQTGDVIKIARVGTTYSIRINNGATYSTTINNTNPLKVSISPYYANSGVNNVTISL